MLVSYTLGAVDNDNPNGTQSASNTITLSICYQPFLGQQCAPPFFPLLGLISPYNAPQITETFTCTDQTPTKSCLEVNVRAANTGP
jgi:hypothetical protein